MHTVVLETELSVLGRRGHTARAGCDRSPSEVLQSSQSIQLCCAHLPRALPRQQAPVSSKEASPASADLCRVSACLSRVYIRIKESLLHLPFRILECFHSVIESRDWITHLSNIARMGIVNICKQNTEIITNIKQMLNTVLFHCFH